MPGGVKQCSCCGEVKPTTAFRRRRHYSRDGLRSACSQCESRRDQERRQRLGALSRSHRGKERAREITREAFGEHEGTCHRCGAAQGSFHYHHVDYARPKSPDAVQVLCETCHALEHGVRSWTRQLDLFPSDHYTRARPNQDVLAWAGSRGEAPSAPAEEESPEQLALSTEERPIERARPFLVPSR